MPSFPEDPVKFPPEKLFKINPGASVLYWILLSKFTNAGVNCMETVAVKFVPDTVALNILIVKFSGNFGTDGSVIPNKSWNCMVVPPPEISPENDTGNKDPLSPPVNDICIDEVILILLPVPVYDPVIETTPTPVYSLGSAGDILV